MADHPALSFTATLQFAEAPINVLGDMTTGPVTLVGPHQAPDDVVEGATTLGMLNGTDTDWHHGQEIGLITFEPVAQPAALLLYFRHSEAGYRLYLRNGPHSGEGVFTTGDGLVNVEPIKAKDPSLWTLTDAQTGEAFDLTQLEDGRREILLASADGHPLEVHSLYPVGGFLACYPTARQGTLSLIIQERGVDWLKPA
ncbi:MULTISPECIES: hypothetical protein [Pseudomonas]|uniref:Uncharacterized protein n=1 Tax=Pseudomonas vlassakiae TaxID=485888 RepID=A0A923GNC2_9PSED|nr:MULTISPECIES: hypothetical protein [Pseudomonas]MBH3414444.1 hypothetical protein [Pseudomonas putida]MBV4544090.1 hypothetical protein [Pseudomonas vlassakiae]